MHTFFSLWLLWILSVICFAPQVAADEVSLSPSQIIANYFHAVVKIEREEIGGSREWSGSGVFFTEKRIITNAHVVGELPENPEKFRLVYSESDLQKAVFWVSFGGKKYKAKFVGRDPEVDLAILEVETEIIGVIPAPLGNSENVEIGEEVFAFGNPFGMENTVTNGIISQKEKKHGLLSYEEYLQTTAAINPGNSGGPLVSKRSGKIIGIVNSGINFANNMGYAIPINIFSSIEPELKGTVRRSWIGINFPLEEMKDSEGFKGLESIHVLTGVNDIARLEKIRNELFEDGKGGVILTDVMRSIEHPHYDPAFATVVQDHTTEAHTTGRKPPAYKAGLQITDIIKKFGNADVHNSRDLIRAIFYSTPYQKTTIEIVRFEADTRSEISIEITPVTRVSRAAHGGFY